MNEENVRAAGEQLARMLDEVRSARIRPPLDEWKCPLCGGAVCLSIDPERARAELACAEDIHFMRITNLELPLNWHLEFVEPWEELN